MAKMSEARKLAESRAAAMFEPVKSFKDAGVAAVRSLELNAIMEGDIVTIPEDYKIFPHAIPGSDRRAYKVITEEGKDFFIGCLTRGAKPADGGEYVRPSGSVVDTCQKYGNLDDFFQKEMAGKKVKFTKKTVVIADAFSGEGTSPVNVWTLDFVA